jgi:hypothetical protein
VILLALFCVSAAVTNTVPTVDSFSIAVRSWPISKRGASGQFQDICQVSSRNFDWLPFTPPLVAFYGHLIGIRAGLVTS